MKKVGYNDHPRVIIWHHSQSNTCWWHLLMRGKSHVAHPSLT